MQFYILLALVECSIHHLLKLAKEQTRRYTHRGDTGNSSTLLPGTHLWPMHHCRHPWPTRERFWLNNWSSNVTVVDIHNFNVATHSLKSTVAHKCNTPLICTLLLCQVLFLHTRYDRGDRSSVVHSHKQICA